MANQTEATVEVWAKRDSFCRCSRVFEFGAGFQSMSLLNRVDTENRRSNVYQKSTRLHPNNRDTILVPGLLRTSEWVHVAAVSAPGDMALYPNGELTGTHANEARFADMPVALVNGLGRGLAEKPNDDAFHSRLDELPVWDHRRTETQIRARMLHSLSGGKTGLAGRWNVDAVDG